MSKKKELSRTWCKIKNVMRAIEENKEDIAEHGYCAICHNFDSLTGECCYPSAESCEAALGASLKNYTNTFKFNPGDKVFYRGDLSLGPLKIVAQNIIQRSGEKEYAVVSKENGLLTFFEDDLCAEKAEESA